MSAAPSTEVAQAPAQDVPATESGHKIFVGNLAYATTDEGLKALFAGIVSDILSVQVIQRGTRSAGYGFVSVSEVASVEKAVAELNKKELDGRAIIVEAAKPAEDKEKEKSEKRTKKRAAGRRGNKAPPGEVTEAEANGEAAEQTPADAPAATGEDKPKKKSKKTRKPKAKKTPAEGEAAATDAAPAADAAAKAETPAADAAPKKAKRTRTPKAPRAEGEQPDGEPSKSVVFVANLAFNVDDAALAELFTSAGINVVSARVVRRRFGQPRRSKGYGFVDVGDEEQQKKALEAFAGKEVAGREIAVKIAVSAPAGASSDEAPAGALTEEALAKKAEAERPAEAEVLAH